MLNVLGALQCVQQCRVVHRIIQAIGTEQDAIKQLEFNHLDFGGDILGQACEKGVVEIAVFHMVDSAVLHVALDVDDVATAVAGMDYRRLIAFDTCHH